MKYLVDSWKTFAYWKYALFSSEAVTKLCGTIGFIYLAIEIADFFSIYTKDKHSQYGILLIALVAIFWNLMTRRPVTKIAYKIPGKDYSIEVKIGDIFKETGEIIISSNSTFDTDLSSGLIATNSLQGQFATKFFNAQTAEIDRQIDDSLKNDHFELNDQRPGKKREYPIGTVARVRSHGRNFYLVAMSHMGSDRNARSSVQIIDVALERLWTEMVRKAETGTIVMPLIGTGRGRVSTPRKKMVEKIAQSFADASREHVFCNKLVIVVHPDDAADFSLNLFQVRDYLGYSLHT